ncbi:aminodeoxychorismate synthase component I [Entomomonas asaccharolytica]|uniref:Aminodeoxychorismate synthase component I n=1 Tax=Entomomonas asaccharolytica TaxID=2785331 RepID=A0A974NGR9_9GAMM|nr:aminodeoxychorismate synthase component I [Entomomonas asaccharolytica]QQP86199.1 aminodeoxychorismate synthase component I [Entomomonas asaccharolytica]
MIHLQFDFNGKSLTFCHPLQIIQTHQLDQVISCFHQLQTAIKQGYYIAGYVSYEAAAAFTPYFTTHPKGDMPLLWFGVFEKPIEKAQLFTQYAQTTVAGWQIDTSRSDYQQAIQTIHHEISKGNVYQVNYTVRLNTAFNPAESYAYYQKIHQAQQASYSAYLDMGEFQLLSASPELFFHWQQGTITTKPMKGTIARGKTLAEDKLQTETLANSTKDQAENLMIVDLLRNDLSKIANLDSITVPKLFTIEKYPTVLQMTSTITAQTKPSTTLFDIFKALFPCGSITGAPKASAMEVIKQLEATAREAYCGAIGFVTPDNEATFNVAIRTIKVDTSKRIASYGVGGGITWDSTASNEYKEVLTKAKVLTTQHFPQQLLESLLLVDGKYFLLSLHLKRLKNSANYFNFSFSYQQITVRLQQLAATYANGYYKVRLLLNSIGQIDCEATTLFLDTAPLQARWSDTIMNSQNILLYHKTTSRDFFPKVKPEYECLMTNEKGEVTEFVNGNLVILSNGKWLTPPISSGLLAGTLRQWLLNKKYITEQILYKKDIQQAQQILFINSVRGARKVILS